MRADTFPPKLLTGPSQSFCLVEFLLSLLYPVVICVSTSSYLRLFLASIFNSCAMPPPSRPLTHIRWHTLTHICQVDETPPLLSLQPEDCFNRMERDHRKTANKIERGRGHRGPAQGPRAVSSFSQTEAAGVALRKSFSACFSPAQFYYLSFATIFTSESLFSSPKDERT